MDGLKGFHSPTNLMVARAGDSPGVNDITALKHVWWASGISGTTITDAKNGIALTDATISDNGDGSFNADTPAGGTVVTGGNLVDAGTSDILMVMAAQNGASSVLRFRAGGGSARVLMQSQTSGALKFQGVTETPTTYLTTDLTANSNSTDYTMILAADRDGNLTGDRYTTSALDSSGSVDMSAESAVGIDISLNNTLAFQGNNIWGAAIFVFTGGLPDGWKSVVLEMAGIWRQGYEYLPTQWTNL